MEFRIDETWWITTDKHCFKLCKLRKKNSEKKGLVEWLNPEMYFTNLNSLIRAWTTEKVKESKSKTTEDLIEDIKKISEEIDKVYDKINKQFNIHVSDFNEMNKITEENEEE